jgi:hypothetical protein
VFSSLGFFWSFRRRLGLIENPACPVPGKAASAYQEVDTSGNDQQLNRQMGTSEKRKIKNVHSLGREAGTVDSHVFTEISIPHPQPYSL